MIYQLQIHPAFAPLLETPHDIANIEGGRGGMKSEQTGKCILTKGLDAIKNGGEFRGLIVRETQSSIRDSSHKLLADCIYHHGMAVAQNGPFEVQADRILHRAGDRESVEYIFKGIREDPQQIKSLKGINGTLFEEAETASATSIRMLEPTVLREKGAFLWYVWNPMLVSSAIWMHLMGGSPPPNTLHIHTSYLDNPWLSETMLRQAEHLRDTDFEQYEHVWLGKPISEVKGAIYRDEMKAVQDQGRILQLPYNRNRPVDTAWDLGMGDPTCIWFTQQYDGWTNFIDFIEMTDRDLADVLIEVQNRGYVYRTHWLPHDGINAIIHKRFVAGARMGTVGGVSVLRVMEEMGMPVKVSDVIEKWSTVDAGRRMLATSRFDAVKCAKGIDAMRFYQWDKEADAVGKRKPLHNWACHAPEAFQVAAVNIRPDEAVRKKVAVVAAYDDDEEFAFG